ncbi:mucin-15 [Cottoperca gobio]|uniref:Mucin-15 n=1 Tax=Cottoperca gobio TaxID=56716 RepID=A0A6J2P7V0_COTGO|nr:mucin-15 [Cottoperca gobio]
MGIINGEERNVSDQDQGENGTSDDQMAVTTTTPPAFPTNVTTKQPEFPDATVSPTTATTDPTNSSQINMTEAEEEFKNFTTTPPNNSTHLSAQNSTSFSDSFNRTNLQTTTLAPKSNTTQESTTKPVKDTGITNASEFAATTTTMQELNKTSTMPPSTTVFPPETTETSPATTSANAPITPEKANKTDKGPASGDNSERGVATDTQKSKRNGAWGAVLGMGVAVAFVALVAYVILKKKQQKGFSHRKLVEEYPSDPVLRLGNNEHLDLDFGPGRSAYYNPALQGDNIQMSNIP